MYSSRDETVIEELASSIADDGKIVIADTFVTESELPTSQEEQLRSVLTGGMCDLSELKSVKSLLKEFGFRNIRVHELTENVRPEIQRKAKVSRLIYRPLLRLCKPLGLVSQRRLDSIEGAIVTDQLVEEEVLGFFILAASMEDA